MSSVCLTLKVGLLPWHLPACLRDVQGRALYMENGDRGGFLQSGKVTRMIILPRGTHLCSVLSCLWEPGLPTLPNTTCSTPHPLSQPLEIRSLAPTLSHFSLLPPAMAFWTTGPGWFWRHGDGPVYPAAPAPSSEQRAPLP